MLYKSTVHDAMLRSTASPPLPPLHSVRLLANTVERFFRDITDKRIRRGVFTSVPELEAAINEYITMHNVKPKPFIWSAPGDRQGVKGASP